MASVQVDLWCLFKQTQGMAFVGFIYYSSVHYIVSYGYMVVQYMCIHTSITKGCIKNTWSYK